ncbi:MAG: hypothetical protein NVS2B4_10760 [Ramlibacter sp.]
MIRVSARLDWRRPMPFTLRIHHDTGVLVAEACGAGSFANLCGAAALVGATTLRSSERRAVLDLLALDIELAFTDHLQLGTFVAQQLQHLERVASIVPERYRTGASEKAAQKGGLLLHTFTDRELAMAWVRG